MGGGGGFPKLRVPFGGPSIKDVNILGSLLGSPYFGKLLYGDSNGTIIGIHSPTLPQAPVSQKQFGAPACALDIATGLHKEQFGVPQNGGSLGDRTP